MNQIKNKRIWFIGVNEAGERKKKKKQMLNNKW